MTGFSTEFQRQQASPVSHFNCSSFKLVLETEEATMKLINPEIHEITIGFLKNSVNYSSLWLNYLSLAQVAKKNEDSCCFKILRKMHKIQQHLVSWEMNLTVVFPPSRIQLLKPQEQENTHSFGNV